MIEKKQRKGREIGREEILNLFHIEFYSSYGFSFNRSKELQHGRMTNEGSIRVSMLRSEPFTLKLERERVCEKKGREREGQDEFLR